MKALIISFLFCVLFCGCLRKEQEAVVDEWMGRTIEFDQSVASMLLDSTSYCMVYYIDSTVCLSCRLNAWSRIITNIEEQVRHKVKGTLILSPGCGMTVDEEMSKYSHNIPYFIDRSNWIAAHNSFPKKDLFRVFLLDNKGTVLLVGNPLASEKIRNIYVKRMLQYDDNHSETSSTS